MELLVIPFDPGCCETITETIKDATNPENRGPPAFSLLIIWQYFNHLESMNIAKVFMRKRDTEHLLSKCGVSKRASWRVMKTSCSRIEQRGKKKG